MHFLYFATDKLEKFYNSEVERTEETATTTLSKEGSGQADVGGKAKLGSILSWLGLAGLDVQANVSASGKSSLSKATVFEFTPSQKLKALLLKLKEEGRLADFNDLSADLLKVGRPIVFTAWTQLDERKRPMSKIEKTQQAILVGRTENYTITIMASLEWMISKGTCLRFERERFIGGFGTLAAINSKERWVEIDPIVFSYAEEQP